MIAVILKRLQKILDRLAQLKGLPVLIGLILVIISFIAQFVPFLSFLLAYNWLLHVGIIIGLGGMLFSETL
jgi:hypothetical protein